MGVSETVSRQVHLKSFVEEHFGHFVAALRGDDERGLVVVEATEGWRWFSVENLHPTPRFHFRFNPLVVFQAEAEAETRVVLVVHTHPRGPEGLSTADKQGLVAPDGSAMFPGVGWGVCSPLSPQHPEGPWALRVFDHDGVLLWELT